MSYFVRLDGQKEFRRDILESSRMVIGCLKDNRHLLSLRDQKQLLLKKLQTQVKEISLLLGELDKIMPEKHLRQEKKVLLKKQAALSSPEKKKGRTKKKSASSSKKRKSTPKKASKKTPVPTEADKLNSALADIERRLSTLK